MDEIVPEYLCGRAWSALNAMTPFTALNGVVTLGQVINYLCLWDARGTFREQ